MLSFFKRLFGRSPKPTRRNSGRLALRAKYDAAQTNDDNRRHWANADALSARDANSLAVRKVLRERGRYEAANSSYCKGMLLTRANDIVGTGARLRCTTEDKDVNRGVEKAFTEWTWAIGLPAKLRTMVYTQGPDGDPFGILTTNPTLQNRVKLDFVLRESDQCTTPNLDNSNPNAIDGIVFDEAGNPIEYHFLKRHPGDSGATGTKFDRIPARYVIHWFRRDRAGQLRGIPWTTPALPLFAELRGYTRAVGAAAKNAALLSTVIETDLPADTEDLPEPMDTIDLEPGMATFLPNKTKANMLKAEQPTTTYGMFKGELLNEIARCLNMPYNIAAGNSSSYNYSSGRLDHQTYFKAIRVDRSDCEVVVLDRLFQAWLEEAMRVPDLLPDGLAVADLTWKWHWDGFEHVDPLKEANADKTNLSNHATTYAELYAKKGLDWEDELRQRAKEVELMKELGLDIEPITERIRTEPQLVEDEEEVADEA